MRFIETLISMLLHLDKYLNVIVQNYGIWTYGIIFLIIFCETGLVVTPFLPGDSILFAVGALASIGLLKIFPLFVIFYLAAVLGDTNVVDVFIRYLRSKIDDGFHDKLISTVRGVGYVIKED